MIQTLRKKISHAHLRISTELGINLMNHYEKVLIWFLLVYVGGFVIKLGVKGIFKLISVFL